MYSRTAADPRDTICSLPDVRDFLVSTHISIVIVLWSRLSMWLPTILHANIDDQLLCGS